MLIQDVASYRGFESQRAFVIHCARTVLPHHIEGCGGDPRIQVIFDGALAGTISFKNAKQQMAEPAIDAGLTRLGHTEPGSPEDPTSVLAAGQTVHKMFVFLEAGPVSAVRDFDLRCNDVSFWAIRGGYPAAEQWEWLVDQVGVEPELRELWVSLVDDWAGTVDELTDAARCILAETGSP